MNAGRCGVALILVMLLLPFAEAVDSSGSFEVLGSITTPDSTDATLIPSAILSADASAIAALSLKAEKIRVTKGEITYRTLSPAIVPEVRIQRDLSLHLETYELTSPHMRLAPANHSGSFGIYVGKEPTLTLASTGPLEAKPILFSRVSTQESQQGGERREWPHYYQEVNASHLALRASGQLNYGGDGALLLYGPDVIISAAENVTEHQTGERRTTNGPTGELTQTWLYIEFDAAIIETESSTSFQIAASMAPILSWSGTASLSFATGTLDAATTTYTKAPSAHVVAIDGRFVASLTPTLSDDGKKAEARMELQGDLQKTSLVPQAVPYAPGSALTTTVLLVGGASILVAGGIGGSAWHWQRRRSKARGAKECLDMAQHVRDPQKALAALQKARAAQPNDPEILKREAWQLAIMGRMEEALQLYERAAYLLPPTDGSANFDAAFWLLEHRMDLHAAENHIVRALERDAGLVAEVHSEEETYLPLYGRPRFEHAIREAMWKLDRPTAL